MSRRGVLMEALAATPRDLTRLLRPVARRDSEVECVGAKSALRSQKASVIAEEVAHLVAVDMSYRIRWDTGLRRAAVDNGTDAGREQMGHEACRPAAFGGCPPSNLSDLC